MRLRRFRPVARLFSLGSAPVLTCYNVALPRWQGADMRIMLLSDLHVSSPWTGTKGLARLVKDVNERKPDLILLAGDFLADPVIPGRCASAAEIVAVLSMLSAPLGVFAVLGNHDWADCPLAGGGDTSRNSVIEAFTPSPIDLLINDHRSLTHQGQNFVLAGLDSQVPYHRDWSQGRHDPEQALAGSPDGVPVLMMAHEPDYFAESKMGEDLTLSGHTHGGQINLFGKRFIVPSKYGARLAYGLHQQGNRSLVVSGGVGFSGIPLRFMQPSEVVEITLTAGQPR